MEIIYLEGENPEELNYLWSKPEKEMIE